mgnify:CR=1 FL=1
MRSETYGPGRMTMTEADVVVVGAGFAGLAAARELTKQGYDVVVLEGDQDTPMPWSNVIANPDFGTMVSSSGAAFTWAGNSRENRLTPFANDPVADPTGEAIFLRDEDSRAVWGATPGPLPRRSDAGRWVVRHTAGASIWEHAVAGVERDVNAQTEWGEHVLFRFGRPVLGNRAEDP